MEHKEVYKIISLEELDRYSFFKKYATKLLISNLKKKRVMLYMKSYNYQNIKILEISGIDTQKFLQGLTTADLHKLSPQTDMLYTAFANLKGRVISLCFVKYISDNKLLFSVDESIVDKLIAWLKKYGMFSKINITINEDYSLFYTEEGFLKHNILASDALQSNMTSAEVQQQNILNKLAFIDANNFEKFLPAELELDKLKNVVCYSKGCYMGQEVIARMHYKAKLKKELVVIKSTSNLDNLDLKDENSKSLANVVNKVFINDTCYMLAVFHKQVSKNSYKLETGDIIELVDTTDNI